MNTLTALSSLIVCVYIKCVSAILRVTTFTEDYRENNS